MGEVINGTLKNLKSQWRLWDNSVIANWGNKGRMSNGWDIFSVMRTIYSVIIHTHTLFSLNLYTLSCNEVYWPPGISCHNESHRSARPPSITSGDARNNPYSKKKVCSAPAELFLRSARWIPFRPQLTRAQSIYSPLIFSITEYIHMHTHTS